MQIMPFVYSADLVHNAPAMATPKGTHFVITANLLGSGAPC